MIVAVNGSNFVKTIISKYKGVIYDFKIIKNFAFENPLFCVVSV
jgi:hypothetical protein